jgi:hypothetical protein
MKVLTKGHKYELSQFEPIPDAKPLKGLASESYKVSQLIEKLPASEAATNAVIASSALTQKLLENEYGHQTLQFIEKDTDPSGIGVGDDGVTLYTMINGTTNEEVLEMLIDRMKYLQAKFPCKENACCITHLEEGLMWLEKRTRDRVKRGVEGKHSV